MGLLITIEGGEYVGKSSVAIPALKEFFENKGTQVLASREPGGTPEGEEIRNQIFTRHKQGAPTEELTLLFNKARKIHLDQVVKPFLGKDKENDVVVILDRYLDSTRVYQGILGGMEMNKIKDLEQQYVEGYLPDITIILYFPEQVFAQTFSERQSSSVRDSNAWDQEGIEKQLSKQKAYLKLPELSKEWGETRKYILIDASKTKEQVTQNITSEVRKIVEAI